MSARVLFQVPFESEMSDADAERLRVALEMTLSLEVKHPAARPPLGVARLDFHSGLFLVRGDRERRWALECRTWGDPPSEAVEGWRLEAILAASRVDPNVSFPSVPRPAPPAPERRRAGRRRWGRPRGLRPPLLARS